MTQKEIFDEMINRGFRIDGTNIIGIKGNPLSIGVDKSGYPRVTIRLNNRKLKAVFIHRFVAYLKYGDSMFKKGIQVRHLDGNPMNFCYSNIAIGTARDNAMDKPKHVRQRAAEIATSHVRKYNKEEVRKFYSECRSYKETMEKFGMTTKSALWFVLNK